MFKDKMGRTDQICINDFNKMTYKYAAASLDNIGFGLTTYTWLANNIHPAASF